MMKHNPQEDAQATVNVNTSEAIGTLMLGIIALILLVVLLRQMERNRHLLAQDHQAQPGHSLL